MDMDFNNIQADYFDVKNGVISFTSVLIYAPLVLLVLYIIYLFLPLLISGIQGGQNITVILKTILKKISQVFYLVFRPIIFVLKKLVGGIVYLFGDAWSNKNKLTTIVCLISFVIFITSALFFTYGTPETVGVYGQVITPILITLLAISVVYVFMVFNRSMKDTSIDSNKFPKGKDFSEQTAWLFRRTNMYLYAVVCMIIILGVLGLAAWYVYSSGKDGAYAATQVSMLIGAIVFLGVMHMVFKSMNIYRYLAQNRFLELIYNFIFLLPCTLIDIANYFYKEFEHTPKIAYYILGFEMAVILLWILVPIIKKKLYLSVNHDKTGNWKYEIKAIQDSIDQLESDIENLKNISPSIETYYFWSQVMKEKLYLDGNSEKLKALILKYDIKEERIIEGIINDVKVNSKKIFEKQQEIVELKAQIEVINKKFKKEDGVPVSVMLQNQPTKLDRKRMIGDYEKLRKNGVLPVNDYSYDYGISCWVYINSTPPNHYKKGAKNLLNFSNKPKISYDPHKNHIVISTRVRDETRGAVHKKHYIENIKLQKWINLVINYDSGILDVFMDGELVYSQPGLIPFMSTDTVVIGDTEGIKGGICNVVYFASHISKTRIKTNYNYLKNNNPPVI